MWEMVRWLVFVGLKGAGKTTTIRIAVGVSLPTSGAVIVDGHDITAEKPEVSRGTGRVLKVKTGLQRCFQILICRVSPIANLVTTKFLHHTNYQNW
jgi:ABC-type uncharacterized transport system ATPase subunit